MKRRRSGPRYRLASVGDPMPVTDGGPAPMLGDMTPDDRDFTRQLLDRITIAAYELNLKLRAASMMGIHVPVDTAERDGWTEVLVSPPKESDDPL